MTDPKKPHRLAWIKITRPVTVPYSIEAEVCRPWKLTPGVIGNVCGHTRGIELYPHRDGSVTVILRAAFVETWERIPADALELGPLMLADGQRQ